MTLEAPPPEDDEDWTVFDELEAMHNQNMRLLAFNSTLIQELQQYAVFKAMQHQGMAH